MPRKKKKVVQKKTKPTVVKGELSGWCIDPTTHRRFWLGPQKQVKVNPKTAKPG